MSYTSLATGKAGELELSLDYDKKFKTYMTIDTGTMDMFFLIEADELQFVKALLSYLKDDGIITWNGATTMTLGKFGGFRVELIRDDEFEDRMYLILMTGGVKSSLRYELDKNELIEACKNLLDDLE